MNIFYASPWFLKMISLLPFILIYDREMAKLHHRNNLGYGNVCLNNLWQITCVCPIVIISSRVCKLLLTTASSICWSWSSYYKSLYFVCVHTHSNTAHIDRIWKHMLIYLFTDFPLALWCLRKLFVPICWLNLCFWIIWFCLQIIQWLQLWSMACTKMAAVVSQV